MRRARAASRRSLRRTTIRKQIEQCEAQMEKIQPRLAGIENQLADSAVYDAGRKDDLLKLMNAQAELKAQLEQAEEQMLELMMALEELEGSFAD